MSQFCNIISKVCINRNKIQDYFHEEILIIMEEMNFDFLRLLLNSLNRQQDRKEISSNLIYQYIVKCECEIDYEFSEERKKNPWFQGSIGILGILLSCEFVEIYEEIAGEEIKPENNINGSFIQNKSNQRQIGNIEKVIEKMRQNILKISKHTQNGLDKLFMSICREIIRDLFFVFSQERSLKNNYRAQYNEESNEFLLKSVLHCYKNHLYYRELSNLQIFSLLLSPEMFMQAAFDAMQWKPQKFDKEFFKYQKQNYPEEFKFYQDIKLSSQRAQTASQVKNQNPQSSQVQKHCNQVSKDNHMHKRPVTFSQQRNIQSSSCSLQNNSSNVIDSAIQRLNRRSNNQTEIHEDLHRECEEFQDDFNFDSIDDEDLFDLDDTNGIIDDNILLKYEFLSEIIVLCNVDILNLTNNIQPCFKDDKILINEMRRNICINNFNFQNQISMVNLVNKLEEMKLFDTSFLKKTIFNFSVLGQNKLLKLKDSFVNKYEPMMWRPYSWLDAEFQEKLKEKKLECIFGNMTPLTEKHVFLSDLPSSPTFLKFIRNSFHLFYKNTSILSNILKITYELIKISSLFPQIEQNDDQLQKLLTNAKKINQQDQGIQHDADQEISNKLLNKQDIRLSQTKFQLIRLDDKLIQTIKQYYKNPSQQKNIQQSPSTNSTKTEIMENEGLLQSFGIFVDLLNQLDFIYKSPVNSLSYIDEGCLQDNDKENKNNLNINQNTNNSQENKDVSNYQDKKQLLLAKQKEIMQQFQNKQKKFQDQNESILDKSYNTINSNNISFNKNSNKNNSGNKSNGSHKKTVHCQPFQESLLEQQECVICKTDFGITVIHAYLIIDNLSQHFSVSEKVALPSSTSQKYAITACQHITHQKCHEMGMQNIQISRRALSKEEKDAQLETFCTICKSLSNISVVVVDCYFQKKVYERVYKNIFNQNQNPLSKKSLTNLSNQQNTFSNKLTYCSPKTSTSRYPSLSFSNISSLSSPQQHHSLKQSSSSTKKNKQTTPIKSGNNNSNQCKNTFKDNIKKILDNIIHPEIVASDKTIVNQIYSGLEEFVSLLAIISNNDDDVQESYIYNVGDSLLQSLMEKVLLTQNMENYFEKDFKLLENLYLNLRVIFQGYDSQQQKKKQDYLSQSIQKLLEKDIFDYSMQQIIINQNNPTEQISFCMMYMSLIFRISFVHGEEYAVQFSREFLQNILLIFTMKEIISSQKSTCNFNLLKQKGNDSQVYNIQQLNSLISDVKSMWLNEKDQEFKENIQVSCIPYMRIVSTFLQLVSNVQQSNDSKQSLKNPKNNLDPIGELENYHQIFGKYFTCLDLEYVESSLKQNNKYACLRFLKSLHEIEETQALNCFFEFDKKIFSLSPMHSNFEQFYKNQFWKKCQIDFNFPQIEKSPLIMCLICGLQMADNCQRGLKIIQNDISHALTSHKGYCVYIQLQDGLLIYVEKDCVQTSQSLYFDKFGRMANCLNYPEWGEFQLDKTKYQEVEELVINRKLASQVRYILMQTEDDYTYFDDEYQMSEQ